MPRNSAGLFAAAGVAFASALAGGSLAACSTTQDRAPLPDWSSDTTPGGVGDASVDADTGADAGIPLPPATFGLGTPPDLPYESRLHAAGAKTTPCATSLSATPPEIECVLDIEELDLVAQGYAFDIVAPEGACDYVRYVPYMYAAWPIGTGPSTVSYTVQPDGTFSDEVNSQNGTPACPYDYRATYVDGPNCCDGTYTLTITSAQTGKTTTKTAAWGGVDSACYDGAAFWLDGASFDGKGYPLDKLYAVGRKSARIPIKHQSVLAKYTRGGGNSVSLASYWNEVAGRSTPPVALTQGRARVDTRIECVDTADEVLAVIRLHVREWNERAEFLKDGNPNTQGNEPVFGGPLNDYLDWGDLVSSGVDFTRAVRSKE